MIEKRSSYVFNETLILNQLFEDIAQGRVRKINSPSVQTNQEMQENIYQAARQKKNGYFQQNKKNHEIGFWKKMHNYDRTLLAGSMDESDRFGVQSQNNVLQSSNYCRFGYEPSSSGE